MGEFAFRNEAIGRIIARWWVYEGREKLWMWIVVAKCMCGDCWSDQNNQFIIYALCAATNTLPNAPLIRSRRARFNFALAWTYNFDDDVDKLHVEWNSDGKWWERANKKKYRTMFHHLQWRKRAQQTRGRERDSEIYFFSCVEIKKYKWKMSNVSNGLMSM